MKTTIAVAILGAALCGASAVAQNSTTAAVATPEESTAQAHKLLDQMVAALGGDKWLTLTSITQESRTAGFYHGNPSGSYTQTYTTHQYPDHDRIELTKKRDVVEIINGRDAWEVTFQGRRRIPQADADDFFRRRDHSIEMVMRDWMKRPGIALFYGGQKMTDRHLADEVTIVTADNDSVTILIDSSNHLPRRRTFFWRDPEYHDKNEESETYDDWHLADGLPTPFIVTRYRNGDMTRQNYVANTQYNLPVAAGAFDVSAQSVAK